MSKYGLFSGPYFPTFGLNTEISVFSIQSESQYIFRISVFSPNPGKYGPEKTLYLDNFHAMNDLPSDTLSDTLFLKILNLLVSTFHLKFISAYVADRVEELFQTMAFTLKICLHFFDYHLQPLSQRIKSYIKDTNHFLNKIKKIEKLPEGAILCSMDGVGLYPNIPHREGLASLRKFLETADNKQISIDGLAELVKIVLKKNLFEFDEKTWNRNWNEVCTF